MFVKGGGPFKRRRLPYKKNYKLSLNKRIKQAISGVAEKKELVYFYKDQSLYSTGGVPSLSTASAVYCLNNVAEGSDSNQRIGRKITHAYVEIDINVYLTNAGPPTNLWDAGFWSIVLDRQPNNTVASYNDIYDITSGGITFVSAGLAHRNTIVNQDRFVILRREEFSVVSYPQSEQYHKKVFVDLGRLRGGDKTATFNGTGANVPNNAAILFTIAGSSGIPSLGLPLNYSVNLKYRFSDV